jgi:hypothetical protein
MKFNFPISFLDQFSVLHVRFMATTNYYYKCIYFEGIEDSPVKFGISHLSASVRVYRVIG